MGCGDPKQRQLSFEATKTRRREGGEDAVRGESTERADPPEADRPALEGTAAIMAELQAGFKAIDARFDDLGARIDTIHNRVEQHEARIDTAEKHISEVEDTQAAMAKLLDRTERLLKMTAAKAEDLEARLGRNNLRIAGVAESTNTDPMEQYIEGLLTELFGRNCFSTTFAVEKAHRSLAPRLAPGALPRLIARLLNYRDRNAILRRAREVGDLQF